MGRKTLGVHWPLRVFKAKFGHLSIDKQPKIKKQLVYDGVKGVVLSKKEPFDHQLCTELFECTKDKIGYTKKIVTNTKLKNKEDALKVFNALAKKSQLKLSKPVPVVEHEEAVYLYVCRRSAVQKYQL